MGWNCHLSSGNRQAELRGLGVQFECFIWVLRPGDTCSRQEATRKWRPGGDLPRRHHNHHIEPARQKKCTHPSGNTTCPKSLSCFSFLRLSVSLRNYSVSASFLFLWELLFDLCRRLIIGATSYSRVGHSLFRICELQVGSTCPEGTATFLMMETQINDVNINETHITVREDAEGFSKVGIDDPWTYLHVT